VECLGCGKPVLSPQLSSACKTRLHEGGRIHLGAEEMILERAAVALVAFTRIRPGEARRLRREEWDWTHEQIAVRRSVWYAMEGTTKTPQSNRFVTVTDRRRPRQGPQGVEAYSRPGSLCPCRAGPLLDAAIANIHTRRYVDSA
jgi:integrase